MLMDHTIEPLTQIFLNGSFVPALTAYEYRGYIIMTWARPESNGYTSVGIVCKRDEFGSIIKIERIEGVLFGIKKQAEHHGVELSKAWIDNLSPEWLQ